MARITRESPDRAQILAQLEKVLASDAFRRAERSSVLLRYLVERTLSGRADGLKEYTVGVEALGRGDSFDPRTDPIVRAEASRLRARLERYYETDGRGDAVVVELPRGSYVPRFFCGEPASVVVPAEGPVHESPTPSARVKIRWAALIGLITLGLPAVAWWSRAGAPAGNDRPSLRFEVELLANGTLGSEPGAAFALSEDGLRIVFVARDEEGVAHLHTRRLDQADAQRIPGTEGARGPFLSPDGRWVGYWADGLIKRVPVEGGSPVVLAAATDLLGASWGADGQIVAALNPTGALWKIPEAGGTPQAVLDLTAESARPLWPQLLPGGDAILYTAIAGAGADRADIEVFSLRAGERKTLVRGGTYGRYLPNGYLTYVNQGTLYAVPFDLARLEIRGAAVPLLEDVAYSRAFGNAQYGVAGSGILAYRRSPASGQSVVQWLDRHGNATPLIARPGRYNWPRLSPDGRRLALSVAEAGVAGIQVHHLDTGDAHRLRAATEDPSGMIWLPQTGGLVFGSRRGMAWVDSDRDAPPRMLGASEAVQVPWSISPDGSRLAYYEMNAATGFDLWTVAVSATAEGVELGRPEPVVRTPAFEVYPAFSPDGRWLAYASNESGTFEVYVRPFPDDGTRIRVSPTGGRAPRWSPNGREILYQTDQQQLMVATYLVENGSFRADAPRPWGSRRLADTGVLPGFDIAPDGERVVVLVPAAEPANRPRANHVVFLIDFLGEVQRRTGG